MLITFLVLPYSCEKDDIVNSEGQTFKPKVIIEHTSLAKAKHNQRIAPIIKNNQSFTLNRTTHEHESFFETFILDTINVKYIEGPVSHSYTFALIDRNQDSTLINNLVVAKHDEMDHYIALHFNYQLTSNELLNLKNGIYPQEFHTKPHIVEIQDFDFSATSNFNRADCVTYDTIYYYVPCSHAACQSSHESAPCGHPDRQTITVTVRAACPNSPYIGDDNTTDTAGGNVGGGGYGGINWGGNNTTTAQNNDSDVLGDGPLTQINVPLKSKVRTYLINELDKEDLRFLDAYPHIEIALNTYLGNQQINPDANQFVKWSIDYLQNLYLLGTLLNRPFELNLFNSIVNSNLNNQEIINLLGFHKIAEEAILNGGDVDFEEQVIYDNTLNNFPCHKLVISDAIGVCSPLTQGVLNVFEANDNVNLIFKSSNSISSNANTSSTSVYNPVNNTCNITITFRESYLQTATDLSIARTAIHEALHAFLVYMFEENLLNNPNGTPLDGFKDFIEAYINYLSGAPSNLGVAHHELMTDLIEDMATSLSAYGQLNGYSQPFSFYKNLCWSGDLINTPTFQSLYPVHLNPSDATSNPNNINPAYLNIININASEQNNTTYTFNHPNGTTYQHSPVGTPPNTNEPCN